MAKGEVGWLTLRSDFDAVLAIDMNPLLGKVCKNTMLALHRRVRKGHTLLSRCLGRTVSEPKCAEPYIWIEPMSRCENLGGLAKMRVNSSGPRPHRCESFIDEINWRLRDNDYSATSSQTRHRPQPLARGACKRRCSRADRAIFLYLSGRSLQHQNLCEQ